MAKKQEVVAERWPKHKMGNRCGYDEYEDGSIRVAPDYSNRFEEIATEQLATEELLRVLTEHCQGLMKTYVRHQSAWWNSVKEDYSLDFEKYDYFYREGSIERREKPPPEPKPPPDKPGG